MTPDKRKPRPIPYRLNTFSPAAAVVTLTTTLREDGSVGCGAAFLNLSTRQMDFITLPGSEWFRPLHDGIVSNLGYALARLSLDPEFNQRYPR